MKKIEVFRKDKWNMIHVEIQGKQLVVREISDQWGEDTHIFLSRPALMDWVQERFSAQRFEGSEEERLSIIEKFKEV
ncbi:hypothetical protein [Marinicrinis lubricantis]|uniref:Uncharacterized protein n=1 Tax=Marinicrinis lubricantis TaxID=2086470 RepID=A0ABW1IT48_9BACL